MRVVRLDEYREKSPGNRVSSRTEGSEAARWLRRSADLSSLSAAEKSEQLEELARIVEFVLNNRVLLIEQRLTERVGATGRRRPRLQVIEGGKERPGR